MEEFKKKLLNGFKKKIVAPIVLIVIAIVMSVTGVVIANVGYEEFDSFSTGYAKLDVTYLMGPFAVRENSSGKTSSEYYIAEATDGYWYLVETGANNKIPVYGEDIYDEDLNSLSVHTIKGKSEAVPREMIPYIVDFFSEEGGEGFQLTSLNYSDYLGDHYLNTQGDKSNVSLILYFVSGVLVIIAVICLLGVLKKTTSVRRKISELEVNGKLNTLYHDCSMGQPMFCAKYNIAVFGNYILDYSVNKSGFDIISLEGVNNAFRCNMVDGKPTNTSYIALERNDGMRKLIAPYDGKSKDYEDLIAKIKSVIGGGFQW